MMMDENNANETDEAIGNPAEDAVGEAVEDAAVEDAAGETVAANPQPIPVPVPVDPPAEAANGSDPEEQAKRQIPGYQILEKLGAGAMAVVFKARQISLDRIVAIKVLPKKLSADKEYVERFYAEGQAAAKLNNPNIVAAIDVSEAHGYHYFVMEYVEGTIVDDEIKAGRVYTESEALGIIIQITRALEHAHSQGLIHRDVKPKNIMITNDGVAKLMDMGLARLATDADAIQAEAGKLYGTPYYISPEQILGKADVDFRCDIYSLGGTLYHMVTGQVPFEGEDAKAVMIKHVKQKLVPADRVNLDISFGLVKVINKMMAKRPDNRYASTRELLEELESIDFLLEVENPSSSAPLPDLSGHAERPATKRTKAKSATAPVASAAAAQPATAVVSQQPAQASSTNATLVVCLIVSVLLNLGLIVLLLLKG
ncbi:MAG: serine/threonine protein kinase [Phycisphaerae bacterium]|nr:serine/threonine protein kinase [Phycisphaerae bacterium]